ncbi:MAG: SPOR domain-containing protein [Methylococcales bacterium]|nr:SPOR domain-containing protein [Methylococcales bacterium]
MTNKKKRGRNGFSTDLTAEDDSFILADLDNVHNDQDLSLVDLSSAMDNEEVINILLASSDLDYKDEFEHNNFSEDFVTDNKDRANELLGNNPFLIEPIEHDLLTESSVPDTKKIIDLDEIEREEYPVDNTLVDGDFNVDIPFDEYGKKKESQHIIDLLLSGVELSENSVLDSTDPRFDRILSMVESGSYAEAASSSQTMLEGGIFDIRVVCYYLYGYWLNNGLASLADVLNSFNSIILNNSVVLSLDNPLNNRLEKSLYWVFMQLTKTIQYEAKKHTLLWQQWQSNTTENELNNILKAGESFCTVIKHHGNDNTKVLIGLWEKMEDFLLVLHGSLDIEDSRVIGMTASEVAYNKESVGSIKNDLTNPDYQEINKNQKEILSSLAAVRLDQEFFRKQLSSNENSFKKSTTVTYTSLCLSIFIIFSMAATGFVIANLQTKVAKLSELVSILQEDVIELPDKNSDQAIIDNAPSTGLLDQRVNDVAESNRKIVKALIPDKKVTESNSSHISNSEIEQHLSEPSQAIKKIPVNNEAVIAKNVKSVPKKGAKQLSEESENISRVDKKITTTKEVVKKNTVALGWVVNLIAFNQQIEAKNKAGVLVKKGIPVKVVPVALKNKTWYQLQVTGFKNKKDAALYAEKIRKSEDFHSVSVNNK